MGPSVVRRDRNGDLAFLGAVARFLRLAKNVSPTGMADTEPFEEDLLKERGQWDAASCSLPFDALSLVDQNRLLLKVDVVHVHADQFASASPGVRRRDTHGIHPRPRTAGFDVSEKFVDLRKIEKQAIPESLGLLGGETTAADTAVNFFPGHERSLVFTFGKAKSAIRKAAGEKSGLNGPIEAGAKGCQLLSESDRTQGNRFLPFAANTLVEIILKVGGDEILDQERASEFPKNVVEVHAKRFERVRFDGTVARSGQVAVHDFAERFRLH